ncbi:helix-turn-helix domain-containing protein [Streptomyces sp. H39-S7]|nr:helix-turn-helix domain-containing protein [Streptomyces sp. H39-S7]MCZ4124201.1 helix-turn-helix domain-containing protein [Streptomyces sp. H39-S7]
MVGRPPGISHRHPQTVDALASSAKTSQALALRVRTVLACAKDASNKRVAAELGTSAPTVGRWRRRFVESRLEGLVRPPSRHGPQQGDGSGLTGPRRAAAPAFAVGAAARCNDDARSGSLTSRPMRAPENKRARSSPWGRPGSIRQIESVLER